MYFALQPGTAVVNDLNFKLINLYRQVKLDPKGLTRAAGLIQKAYNSLQSNLDDQARFYLRKRSQFNTKPSEGVNHAALFLFLNKAGFNGMYRENAAGQFNIPFGKRPIVNLLDKPNVQLVSELFLKTEIHCGDFQEVFKQRPPNEGDLVYFDPPYVALTKTSAFTSYTREGFGGEMQVALAQQAKSLADRGVHVVISNSSHEDVTELYGSRFRLAGMVDVPRRLAASTNSRGTVKEFLFTSF